ncbi:unnamed protein product, partial [Discosporangium mesarthrocarpum]
MGEEGSVERRGSRHVVWITPGGQGPVMPIARDAVVGTLFEEESLNVLYEARGDIFAAWNTIGSPKFKEALRRKAEARGDLWTEDQVLAALGALRRGERVTDAHVEGKGPGQINTFWKTFATLNRYGQDPKDRRQKLLIWGVSGGGNAATRRLPRGQSQGQSRGQGRGKPPRPRSGTSPMSSSTIQDGFTLLHNISREDNSDPAVSDGKPPPIPDSSSTSAKDAGG